MWSSSLKRVHFEFMPSFYMLSIHYCNGGQGMYSVHGVGMNWLMHRFFWNYAPYLYRVLLLVLSFFLKRQHDNPMLIRPTVEKIFKDKWFRKISTYTVAECMLDDIVYHKLAYYRGPKFFSIYTDMSIPGLCSPGQCFLHKIMYPDIFVLFPIPHPQMHPSNTI